MVKFTLCDPPGVIVPLQFPLKPLGGVSPLTVRFIVPVLEIVKFLVFVPFTSTAPKDRFPLREIERVAVALIGISPVALSAFEFTVMFPE